MWHIHGLSSVIGKTIYSVYPVYGAFTVRDYLHRAVKPRPAAQSNEQRSGMFILCIHDITVTISLICKDFMQKLLVISILVSIHIIKRFIAYNYILGIDSCIWRFNMNSNVKSVLVIMVFNFLIQSIPAMLCGATREVVDKIKRLVGCPTISFHWDILITGEILLIKKEAFGVVK